MKIATMTKNLFPRTELALEERDYLARPMFRFEIQNGHLGERNFLCNNINVKQALRNKAKNTGIVYRIARYVKATLKFEQYSEKPPTIVVEDGPTHDSHVEAVAASGFHHGIKRL